MSIKESARIAQSNNFMGLICRSSLLVCSQIYSLAWAHNPLAGHNLPFDGGRENWHYPLQNVVPALVETIKELGLVLVADTSDDVGQPSQSEEMITADPMGVAEWAYRMPDGVNGMMKANGILRFNDTIDMWSLPYFDLPVDRDSHVFYTMHILTYIQDFVLAFSFFFLFLVSRFMGSGKAAVLI